MATQLQGRDVVIVGLGAAGGIAALPLAEAGLDVVGLEAGTWLTRQRLRARRDPQQRPRLAAGGAEANHEVPTHRPNAAAPTTRAGSHPMMNGVGGTTLHYWAQSWRLNPWDFKVVSETDAALRPVATARGHHRRGLAVRLRGARALLRQGGVGDRRRRPRRQHQGRPRPGGNVFEGPRQRDYPMPPLRGTGFTDLMAAAARSLGWKPFAGPGADQLRSLQDRSACMYHGFCNRGGCHVDAKNGTNVTTIPRAEKTGRLQVVTARARDRHRRRRARPRRRRPLRDRRPGVRPAGARGPAGGLHLRERPAAAALEIAGVPQRAVEQSRPGRAPLPEPRAGRRRDGAVPVQPEYAGTACPRRARPSTTSPTTTSITDRSTSSAAATSGSTRSAGRSARPT